MDFASREIDIPFRIGPDGAVASTDDIVHQLVNHLISIIGTNPPERQMRPEYGVHATDQVFENIDDLLVQHIRSDIERGVRDWEANVDLVDVAVVPSQQDDATDGVLQFDIRFKIKGSAIEHTAQIFVGGTVEERIIQ